MTDTRDFSFPLNVYARLLETQEGRADYLHFAVFDAGEIDVLSAQERASELLWQVLPPPCRLLEVGIGLGTTLAKLGAAGYDAMGITPEAAQIEVARGRHGPALRAECVRLEDFNGRAGEWDALLFQESAQYIEPMALFGAAERLLQPGRASLIVMDEFALKRESPGHAGLHHLDHFCAQAGRFGWTLTQRTELSREVQPTLDYLLRTTRAGREDLMAELGLTGSVIDGLDSALQRSQALYHEGVYGYALLRFDRERAPEDRPVCVAEAQSACMRHLFERVFGHPLSAQEWLWKYGESRGRAVGLQRGEELLAHYGGVTRPVVFQGERVAAVQVCDVVVDAAARRALERNGPLQRVTATFLETQIGWGLPHRIGFGFPTERAFSVAERLGLYAAVDAMACVSWPADGARRPWGLRVETLQQGDLDKGRATEALVNELWAAMATALPGRTLGVRDAAWIDHRYLRHPRFQYQVLLVRRRWTGRVVGLIVLRRHDRHLEWVDVVGEPIAFVPLLATARAVAVDEGLPTLEAWVTHSQQALFEGLAGVHCTVRPLGITVPANAHSPGPSVQSQRGRWFLMAGDTDFR